MRIRFGVGHALTPTMVARAAGPAAAVIAAAALATACSSPAATAGASTTSRNAILAVAAENEYGDVIGQIGGPYVSVDSVMSNPNTDPHSYEASQAVAQEISQAQIVVQNGVGYDSFMTTIESAAANGNGKIIDVQQLLGLPDSTPNPHLWYKPGTMSAVANAIAGDLSAIEPSHASYFKASARRFTGSLTAWTNALTAFKAAYPSTPVATTEPVADYMLAAAGADNLTPWTFQADVMNGIDPAPQTVAAEKSLFTQHKVKVFLYNQQVTDPLTDSLITLAGQNHIPVVGVYETMPVPGYDYQSWMLTEVRALRAAVASGKSTVKL